MTIQIDFWQLLLSLAALIAAFAAVVWVFGTALVNQFKAQLDGRFAAIQTEVSRRAQEEVDVAQQLRVFEKDFLTFQRDLPLQYVRREDYIRGQTVIEAKLDALYSKLELVQMKGNTHD